MWTMTAIDEMKQLVERLNAASRAYYQESREIMSNYEYDSMYDRLRELEKETGTVLGNSPTIHVGYEVVSDLPKEAHESPMLSLDKTKDRQALAEWLGGQKGLLSWKMDGLTIVLTYRDGSLYKAVTRGNGTVGEVVTANARVFDNLPLKIPFHGELVLRGEAVIKYSDFNRINEEIENADAKYKNPRNLCSGSVRQLNNEITAKRHVRFYAFTLVRAESVDFHNSREEQMRWLSGLGFDIVEFRTVTRDTVEDAVEDFAGRIGDQDVPSDGLVLTLDDIEYSRSLGTTAKFPRDSIAFKWADETRTTHLLEVEWSASRTGLLNPIAVFEPVELEGTTVSRASVHNLSIVESLQLGIGDELTVYKANMIIPQIAENRTRSGRLAIPAVCPVCHQPTEVKQENDVKVLYCPNPACEAKNIKGLTLFVSRDAFNIEGLSEATLEKFVQKGFIRNLADIFRLEDHKDAIVDMDGFGEKSYNNLIQAIDKSKQIRLDRFLYALGISGVGLANAKLLCRHFNYDLDKLRRASADEIASIDGIGPVIAASVCEYFADESKSAQVDALLAIIHLEEVREEEGLKDFEGMTFVITGNVHHFANRKEVKELIEARGGKVAGSVSSKTNYLINNDAASRSSKNQKARSLGIPVITEDEFLRMLGENA